MGFEHLREMMRDVQTRNTATAAKSPENVIGFSLAMFEHLFEYRNEWKMLSGSQAGVIVRQSVQDMISELIGQEFKAKLQNEKASIPRFLSRFSFIIWHQLLCPSRRGGSILKILLLPIR